MAKTYGIYFYTIIPLSSKSNNTFFCQQLFYQGFQFLNSFFQLGKSAVNGLAPKRSRIIICRGSGYSFARLKRFANAALCIYFGSIAQLYMTNYTSLPANHHSITNFCTSTYASLGGNNGTIAYFYIMRNLNKVIK